MGIIMYCQNCGKQIPDNSDFCTECGATQKANSSQYYQSTQTIEKIKKPVYKKWWFWVLASIVVFIAIGVIGDSVGGSDGEIEQSPAPNSIYSDAQKQAAQENFDDTETQDSIKASVEALVDDTYKGYDYACDILTATNGSGYIVSLQIVVEVVPPESTEIIDGIESAIKNLNNDKITDIQITAVKDSRIVDQN